jgi:hypothetical protein
MMPRICYYKPTAKEREKLPWLGKYSNPRTSAWPFRKAARYAKELIAPYSP